MNEYFHWRQFDPFSIFRNATKEEAGFIKIHTPYKCFYGLGKLDNFLAGVCEGNCGWYYTVGCTARSYKTQFPGPCVHDRCYIVNKALLWVRTNGIISFRQCNRNIIPSFSIHHMLILVFS